jgi:hypothetical protein
MQYRIENRDLRKKMKDENIQMWLVAHYIGVSECTLSRWLRFPVTPEQRQTILSGIEQAKAGRMANAENQ